MKMPKPGVIIVLVIGTLVLLSGLVQLWFLFPAPIMVATTSPQSLVKRNLKGAFVAERSLFQEKGVFSESLEELGFEPERFRGRAFAYRYIFSARDVGSLRENLPLPVLDEVGVRGTCPDCNITIVGVGNIDADPELDVWSISTEDRTIGTEKVLAGIPYCHVNDKN